MVKQMSRLAESNGVQGYFFVEITSEQVKGVLEFTGRLLYFRRRYPMLEVFRIQYNNPSLKSEKAVLREFNDLFDEALVTYIINARDYKSDSKNYFSIKTLTTDKKIYIKTFNNFEKILSRHEEEDYNGNVEVQSGGRTTAEFKLAEDVSE